MVRVKKLHTLRSENDCELFDTDIESVACCMSLYVFIKLKHIVRAQFILFISRALPIVALIISP